MTRAGLRLINAARDMRQSIAATDAPKGKGGTTVDRTAPIQDLTMLKVVERPQEGKPALRYHTISDTARAAKWLDDRVAGLSSPLAQVVDLDPALASVLLERNDGNRRIKSRRVDDFSRDMRAGNWKLNGEPIVVSDDGHLIDGQHRCAAVMDAKVSIQTFLVLGVARHTQDTVDHGTSRSPGDDLALHGHTNTVQLAAAARMLWQWRQYGEVRGGGHRAPTRVELMQTVDDNPGIVKSLGIVGARGAKARALASMSALAFCHTAFRTVASEVDVAFFFDALIEGESLKRGNPILNARNRLITDRSILDTPMKVELIFRSWNAHRRGDSVRTLFRLSGGELPMLEA